MGFPFKNRFLINKFAVGWMSSKFLKTMVLQILMWGEKHVKYNVLIWKCNIIEKKSFHFCELMEFYFLHLDWFYINRRHSDCGDDKDLDTRVWLLFDYETLDFVGGEMDSHIFHLIKLKKFIFFCAWALWVFVMSVVDKVCLGEIGRKYITCKRNVFWNILKGHEALAAT